MAIDALIAPLLRVVLFQGLKPLQLTEIARRADRIVFRPGEVIVGADRNDAAVLIVSGEAVARGEDAATAEPVPPGALLGEQAMLIEPEEPTTTFIARTTVRALRIGRAEMLALMAADPTLAEHIAGKIADRLRKFADELRAIEQSLAPPEPATSPPVPADAAA